MCRAAARGGSLGTLYSVARSQGAQETGAIFNFWLVCSGGSVNVQCKMSHISSS